MESLGARIRKRRGELGLKVYELATKVRVNPVYITQIEKHDKLPSPAVFKKIEKALGLGSECETLYVQKKYPYFGDTLKAIIKESETHPKIGEELLRKFMESGKENNSRLIAVSLLKQINPSQVDNTALINKLIKKLKDLMKEQKDLQKKKMDLVNLVGTTT